MDRRDFSIMLIFLMLAVGGGLPQALHWRVDHGCGEAPCAAAGAVAVEAHPLHRCDHHHPALGQTSHAEGDEAHQHRASADAADEAVHSFGDEPGGGDDRDCAVCQFLATLSANVAPALIASVDINPVAWCFPLPGTAVAAVEVSSSHGPRAPPHVI